MQKHFVLFTFLFIFTIILLYVGSKITEHLAEKVAEEIAVEAAREVTQEALKIQIEEVSNKIIDTEVLDRVKDLPLNQDLLLKLMQDILAIESAHNMQPDCEQYALLVVKAGMFPILQTTRDGRREIKAYIRLHVGEVWRYGSTAFGEEKRYADGIFFISKDGKVILNKNNLRYYQEFRGEMMDVLIEEKIKIYSYPLLPECFARVKTGKKLLLRSPGNKIYK